MLGADVSTQKIKFGGMVAARIEPEALEQFIANAEACKSTKDIVLRELVYAFNRFCEGGRSPVLQRLEVVAPGYIIAEDGRVEDATPGAGGRPQEMIYPNKSHAAKKPRKGQQSGAA